MKQVGDTISLGKGVYTLEKYLGGGIEGSVFQITNNGKKFAVKILNTDKITIDQQEKIKRHLNWISHVVSNCRELGERIVYPMAFVKDTLGYAMTFTGDHESLKNYLNFPTDEENFNKWYKTKYNLKKRYQIIESIFKTLELIHINGLLFTDISPNNIMVHKTQNNTMFIDIDNIRTRKDAFLNVYGTEGYMAPELYRPDAKALNSKFDDSKLWKECCSNNGRLTAESDIFAAAIIAFQLLTLQHPFIGDVVENGSADDEAAALRCETDYVLHNNQSNISTTLPFVQLLQDEIISTKKINELFYRTFVVGKDNPMLRPTAKDFAEAFSEGLDHIVRCEKCGQYRIYNPGKENLCWDCGEDFGKKIIIEIYAKFEESNRDLLVDQILDKPRNNQLHPLINGSYCLLSSLVMDNDYKFVYSRHLEWRLYRDTILCKINVIDPVTGELSIALNKNDFIQKVRILNNYNNHDKSIEPGRQNNFNYNTHRIVMEKVDSRVGKIEISLFFREN